MSLLTTICAIQTYDALNEEYKKRYNHTEDHLHNSKVRPSITHPPKNAKLNKLATDPTPPMPEHCVDDAASYRNYYILEKKRFAT